MNKKLTSILLSALLLIQPVTRCFANTDKPSNPVKNDDSYFSKIFLGIVGIGGLGTLTAYLIHRFGQQSTDYKKIDPKRRLALNDAVKQLYHSEYRSKILSFPHKEANILLKNNPLDLSTRSALSISIALQQAFEQASLDLSAINLTLNEDLFTVLDRNIINNSDDFTALLRNIIDVSRDVVMQSPTIPQKEKRRTTHKINSDAEKWLTGYPEFDGTDSFSLPESASIPKIAKPLRSIRWHDHLCWFHSSLLLFFHEKHYREFICSLPDNELENLLVSENTSAADKTILLAMYKLSNMFQDLAQNSEKLIDCVDYSQTIRERDLLETLKNAFAYVDDLNTACDPHFYDNMHYGESFDIITTQLYNLIKRSSQILKLDTSELPDLEADTRGFVGLPNLKIVHSSNFSDPCVRGHYWLEISQNGKEQKLAIGELTDPRRSIETEQATGFIDRRKTTATKQSTVDSKKEAIIIDDEEGKPADPATTNEGSAPEEEKPAKTGKKNNPKATNKKKQNKSTRKSRKPSSAGKKGKSKSIDRK